MVMLFCFSLSSLPTLPLVKKSHISMISFSVLMLNLWFECDNAYIRPKVLIQQQWKFYSQATARDEIQQSRLKKSRVVWLW
jgi:hypothetical protein